MDVVPQNGRHQCLLVEEARSIQVVDPQSPEEQVGPLGFLYLAWFTPIVDLAFSRSQEKSKLDHDDLFSVASQNRARLHFDVLQDKWNQEVSMQTMQRSSVVHALASAFGKEIAATGILKLFYDVLHFVNPYLLSHLLHSFGKGSEAGLEGVAIAIGMVLVQLTEAFVLVHYYRRNYRTALRVRSGLILLIYSKGLRTLPWEMPTNSGEHPEPGGSRAAVTRNSRLQVSNLMSADTDKFTNLMPNIHLIWSAPLQIVICFCMLFSYVSWAAIAGSACMASFLILSASLQNKSRMVQAAMMRAKDARVQFQTQLLKHVKIIKLYAWELATEARVKELRGDELGLQLRYKFWNLGQFLSWQLSPSLVSVVTFAYFACVLKKQPNVSVAFTAVALFGVLNLPFSMLPQVMRSVAETSVAAKRIQSYLLSPEVPPMPSAPLDADNVLDLRVSRLCWPQGAELLRGINLQIRVGEFVVIVGKTGSGKSGLLSAMLGELPFCASSGDIGAITGPIGYCAQNPWIRNASLRDNITGSADSCQQDDAGCERYHAILEACALSEDLRTLPSGDETIVGDRGISLSGGQKQRVALARAVYSDPSIFVFDDVLSAVDSHVSAHVCSNLLRGPLLKGKTVILVTHSRRGLALADRVIALEAGCIAFDGVLDDFYSSGILGGLDFDANHEKTSQSFTSYVATDDKLANRPSGKRTHIEGQREVRRQGAVSFAVYKAYMKAAGGVFPVGLYLFSLFGMEGCKNSMDIWLSHWSDHGDSSGIVVYVALAMLLVVVATVYIFCRIFTTQAAARQLHQQCQHALLRGSMSFFDQTPMGQILNRLAEDTSVIESTLPIVTQQSLATMWRATAIIVLCMLVGWYLLAILLPMFYLYSRRATRYLPAMRDLRRLDAAAKSPILHHFTETISGASTIRAMRKQSPSFEAQVLRLERQNQAYYLSQIAPRWLSLRNQLNSTLLVGVVATLAAALSSTGRLRAGIAALAISYVFRINEVLNLLNQSSADREAQFISVERLHQYIAGEIEQESALLVPDRDNACANWPRSGCVVLRNVTARYRAGLPAVLNCVSLDIQGGERVGIVGRTGCGKSTLLSTLLRLLEPESGEMLIDDVDIRSIGLHSLRSKVAIIPQEPAILTGTIRFNLDPLQTFVDADLWKALEKSQLQSRIEDAGGLDANVDESGSNFSVGELQLFCLARVLLRRLPSGGLLLLDEATSSLDAATDQKIQEVVRAEFKCTTIAIAHRIETLLDYDRIAVLDAGRVIEFGAPTMLLSTASRFRALACEAGCALESTAGQSSHE